MSYTKDQEQIVLKVLSYSALQYYEVLAVEKTSSEGDIKKSYRKLAIKLHPDKNPHPRASEAFKLINKAWGVLSDPSKKKIYDQTGADPDSRFLGFSNSSSAATSSGYAQQGFDGAFQDDIFNMFFGGGAARAGGPTFAFGNNGFTFHSFGGDGFDPFTGRFAQQQRQRTQRQRTQQQRQQQEVSTWETIKQLAPILIILLATLFSSLFSGESTPEYSFNRTQKFSVKRTTPNYKIPYYVGSGFLDDKSKLKLRNFDSKVENVYIQDRRAMCSREQVRKNELMDEAQGWFYTDQHKLNQANAMPMPNCQELRNMGIL